MSEIVFFQNVSKKTYLKVFLIASSPVLFIFVWSWLDGNKPSFQYLIIALCVLNGVLLGGLKIAFPKRVALKFKDNNFYVFHRRHWFQFDPTRNLILKPGHVRILLNNRYISIHLKEQEYKRLVSVIHGYSKD